VSREVAIERAAACYDSGEFIRYLYRRIAIPQKAKIRSDEQNCGAI